MAEIRRAVVSVSDKADVVGFVRALVEMGVEILSTGGTAKTLRDNGIKVIGQKRWKSRWQRLKKLRQKPSRRSATLTTSPLLFLP